MADFNPGDKGAWRLKKYWLTGPGALRVKWGTKGDWTRCVALLTPHMGIGAKGYCTELHKAAVGFYPGDKRNR